MNIVNWSFITGHQLNTDHPDCIKPLLDSNYYPFVSLSSDIISERKGITFLKCPAHTDFLKNTFVFCAPFDLTIDLEINESIDEVKLYCKNITQDVFESIIDTRFLHNEHRGVSKYPLIGIDWLTVFTANRPTMIQVLPAFMHRNDFTEKTTIVPGEYDIHNWTRPVETVFEVRSNTETIVIKKGDAISYVKFLSDDNIKLVEAITPWNEISVCNDIRNTSRLKSLKERYVSLAAARIDKCPYDQKE
jgi:hypothetical protein